MERGPLALFGAIVAVGLGPALWLGVQFGGVQFFADRPPTVSEQPSGKQELLGGNGAAADSTVVDPVIGSTPQSDVLPLNRTRSRTPSPSASASPTRSAPSKSPTASPSAPTKPSASPSVGPSTSSKPDEGQSAGPTVPPGPPTSGPAVSVSTEAADGTGTGPA
ncbi:MAG TPA: hypothetical protein VGB74_12040 [Actinoplanes sp.]|jgi:hypothetical protein